MLLPNFKFILRRFNRQRLNTFLHLTGLTLGITVCLLIGLFIHHELTYDNYHEKADRIYRFNQIWQTVSGEVEADYSAPAPLGDFLRTNFPSIETVASVYPLAASAVEITPQKRFNQEGILYAESTILDVFDFEVLEGNGHETLRKPWHALLTTSSAEKFFGRENPIGKTFLLDNEHTVTVGGIIADVPDNTHLPATMLVSYPIGKGVMDWAVSNWGAIFGASTYAVLKEGASPTDLEAPIQAQFDQRINDPEDPEKSGIHIQPLAKIHLEPQYAGGSEWVQATNPKWLWFFGAVGSIVLILACINFINLSTAQSMRRAKEVGVRKAIGGNNAQLITQFIAEAFLLVFVSAIFAVVLAQLAQPHVNQLLDKKIFFDYLFTPNFLAVFVGAITLISLLTGIYPAWLTARFQPATALKSRAVAGNRSASFLRKSLVITQFTLSGTLLIALLIISEQMDFFYTKNLGFDKDNVVTVKIPTRDKTNLLTAELAQITGVKNFTFTSGKPSQRNHNGTIMHPTDLESPERQEVNLLFGDANYSEMYQLQLLAGRFYTKADSVHSSVELPKDQRTPKILVNETLVKSMGFASNEAAIGQQFKIGWYDWQPEIVGVVQDFVTNTLHESIKPTAIFQNPRNYNEIGIKIAANSDVKATLAGIETVWRKAFPNEFYEYEFLDEHIAQAYDSESRLLGFFKIFAGLAMFISCLGLWGLATFAAVQRTKELGIRKVLGATTENLVALLSKDFLALVGIALLIAMPIAWYGSNEWLNNFAFRIEINGWTFVLAAVAALSIAFLTVSFQSIRAALTNPVESLRGE
ncbi:MAG: FtsX-like permease family protein [Bacteroidota bacterium]